LAHTKALYITMASVITLMLLVPLASPVPVHATSITANPASSTVGSPIIITGEGFNGHKATVLWDCLPAVQNVPITDEGKFTCSLMIPHASKGNHKIEVTDDSNWSGSTASLTFTVLPKIKIIPEVGPPSTPIMVLGSGFAAEEKNIKVILDGNTVATTPATADTLGRWSTSFSMTQEAKGEHSIEASGSVTSAAEVGQVIFIAGPAAKMKPVSGPVGTEVTIKGFGFHITEDGITVTYDNTIIKCNIIADSVGIWQDVVTIPPSTQGHHVIGVYGSDFTPKGIVPDTDFEVIPNLELQPAPIGNDIRLTIAGTGFANGEKIAISLDNTVQNISPVADDKGSFNTILTISQYKGGEHIAVANGDKGNSAQASFITETAPPQTPQLLSPKQNAKVNIFNSIGSVFLGTTRYLLGAVTLSGYAQRGAISASDTKLVWIEPTNSEDLSYALQIASAQDFSAPILSKEVLIKSEYTLSRQDGLTSGKYYWRVKAADKVGNESPWSEVWEFEVTPMSTLVLILSIAIPLAFISIILIPIIRASRSRRSNW
jgi:hypothetical protein